MNLRDRLNAMAPAAKKQVDQPKQEKPKLRCWEKTTLRPLQEFPNAFQLDIRQFRMLYAEELPQQIDPRRIVYLDTETTGLSGGAGTVAFEIGVGRLLNDGFEIKQLVMRDYPEEGPMLERLAQLCDRADVLCTFNGKTFDLPLLKSRFLMNRMKPECLEKPHIDLLVAARRIWKLRLKRCNLGRLQEMILGIPRSGDLPGSEVPKRYFDYLKTGEFALLSDVLTHNEQDIASLCVLLNYMAASAACPERMDSSEDIYSLGRAFEKQKHHEQARHCYRLCSAGKMKVQGQLHLAHSYKLEGYNEASVQVWQRMVNRGEGGIEPYIELAKFYEHRAHDPAAALVMAERAWMKVAEPTLFMDSMIVQEQQKALQHRIERLRRKCANTDIKEKH